MRTVTFEEKSIRRNLYRVLRKTGITRERICLNASFIDDLNFDKIDWTIFAYYLEWVFNIRITDEELTRLGSVNDTLHFLRNELVYMSN